MGSYGHIFWGKGGGQSTSITVISKPRPFLNHSNFFDHFHTQLNTSIMAPTLRRLKIAVSGLGRMGARHANHFLHRTPKAELVAAFTPAENELAWAKENLEPWGVKIYSDYDDMLKHEGLEAVCVATVTTAHAEQSIKAIEAGLHVLCEKPLSTNLDIVCAYHPSYLRVRHDANDISVPASSRHCSPSSQTKSHVRFLPTLRLVLPLRILTNSIR
jgi:hypothetical protein